MLNLAEFIQETLIVYNLDLNQNLIICHFVVIEVKKVVQLVFKNDWTILVAEFARNTFLLIGLSHIKSGWFLIYIHKNINGMNAIEDGEIFADKSFLQIYPIEIKPIVDLLRRHSL